VFTNVTAVGRPNTAAKGVWGPREKYQNQKAEAEPLELQDLQKVKKKTVTKEGTTDYQKMPPRRGGVPLTEWMFNTHTKGPKY